MKDLGAGTGSYSEGKEDLLNVLKVWHSQIMSEDSTEVSETGGSERTGKDRT